MKARCLLLSLIMVALSASMALAQAAVTPQVTPATAAPADAWVDFESHYPSSEKIDKMDESQAQLELQKVTAEQGKELGEALTEFKKGLGLGITVAPDAEDRVEEAILVDDKIVATKKEQSSARLMFEYHQLLTSNIFTTNGREAAKKELKACELDPLECPMWGVGPFLALQMGEETSVLSVGVGIMVGVRNDPRKDTSFNFGIGVQWDNKTKQLAKGFREGGGLPAGEEEIRFVEKGAARLMFGISLGF